MKLDNELSATTEKSEEEGNVREKGEKGKGIGKKGSNDMEV